MLGGEPGTGKSTLALQWALSFESCLYLAAEESAEQVRDRASRVGDRLLDTVEVVDAMGGTSIDSALAGEPTAFVILDSLPGLVGVGPASDQDALAVLKVLKTHASRYRSCVLVVDHATKADDFAGRLSLQHEVDTTIVVHEGVPDRWDDQKSPSTSTRTLRTRKNRSGPPRTEVGELGHQGFVARERRSECHKVA